MAQKIKLITYEEFLQKYNFTKEQITKTGYKWEDLEKIMTDYESRKEQFRTIGIEIADQLMSFEKVHSVRFRVKSTDDLIDKIVRKKLEKNKDINLSNYLIELPDLIGVRALHIFKGDYLILHNQILEVYKKYLCQNIQIKVRKDADTRIYTEIIVKDDSILANQGDYSSIHYVINYKDARVEIQTRTIFEEGYSETAHMTIYKKNIDNDILTVTSSILSSLASNCDGIAEVMRKVAENEQKRKMSKADLSINTKNIVDILEKFISEQ